MRKAIICLTCLAALAYAAVASAQITGGVKAGLNLSNMSFSGSVGGPSLERRTSWMAGAFLDIPLAAHIALQPEAILAMKGTKTSLDFSGVGGTSSVVTLKTSYLDVPVLLRVDAPTSGKVVPYLYGGPNIGFLLTAKAAATVSSQSSEVDVKKGFKSTDFGIAVGGGVRFGRVFTELRYTHGFTNVIQPPEPGSAEKATNRVIKVIAGVRF